jgi:hypothetical protein
MSQWTASRICAEPRSMAGNVAGPRQGALPSPASDGIRYVRRSRRSQRGCQRGAGDRPGHRFSSHTVPARKRVLEVRRDRSGVYAGEIGKYNRYFVAVVRVGRAS